jgi:hypothetical protein
MSKQPSRISPETTTMIRLDHSHVLTAFHRYHLASPWWRKRAIAGSVCSALEIHAQLEEEIFYPALARVAPDNETLRESRSEHDGLREKILDLRSMGPDNAAFDDVFMQLMRETIHHVADEETVLLPIAERSLKPELRSLGSAMTRRRVELLSEQPGRIAIDTAGTFPVATAVVTGMILFGAARLRARWRSPDRRYGD